MARKKVKKSVKPSNFDLLKEVLSNQGITCELTKKHYGRSLIYGDLNTVYVDRFIHDQSFAIKLGFGLVVKDRF